MARLFDDGLDQYLALDVSIPVTDVPFAMGCWYYWDAFIDSTLMNLNNDDNSQYYHWLVLNDFSGGKLQIWTRDAGNNENADASIAPSNNVWQHGLAIVPSTTDRRIFLNGGNKGSDNVASDPGSLDRMRIGAPYIGVKRMSGSIAEAAIWNLSAWPGATASDKGDAFEAIAVRALGMGYAPSFFQLGLVSYWALVRDEDQDRVGGYDPTAINAPSISAHPPIIYPAVPFVGMGVPAAAVRTPRYPFYVYQVPAIV